MSSTVLSIGEYMKGNMIDYTSDGSIYINRLVDCSYGTVHQSLHTSDDRMM